MSNGSQGNQNVVARVDFVLLDSKEIKRMGVLEVDDFQLYDKSLPRQGGPNDHRMGTVDRRVLCGTCGYGVDKDLGHPGYIKMGLPLYHPLFLDSINKVLRCVCFFCSHLVYAPDDRKLVRIVESYAGKYRFAKVAQLYKPAINCFHCNQFQPKYVKNAWQIRLDWADARKRHRSALKAVCREIQKAFVAARTAISRDTGNTIEQTIETFRKNFVHAFRSVGEDTADLDLVATVIDTLKGYCEIAKTSKCPADDTPAPTGVPLSPQETANLIHKSVALREISYAQYNRFTPSDAYNILRYIPEDELETMGFNVTLSHPRNMIIRTLLVPPPNMRPAIMVYEGSKARGQDELTRKIQDIVKKNNQLKQVLAKGTYPANSSVTAQAHALVTDLQVDLANYMSADKSVKSSLSRGDKAIKSLSQRLKGKTGRLRSNLMGKRVDFSARTVISPDPLIDLDEVGVPKHLAIQLTFPDRVTRYNIESLMRCIIIGPGNLGGAENVIMEGEEGQATKTINLKYCQNRSRILLKTGWIVERYIRDGDRVLINRQPSLHKTSIMAHRVRIMPGLSLRLNLSVVGPYNADFDGDEMNLHIIQSIEAMPEVIGLMSVKEHLISTQNNKPAMGLVQDALLAMYLLTRKDTFIKFSDLCDFMMQIKYPVPGKEGLPTPTILKPVKLWTGKQLFSVLLPKKFCWSRVTGNLEHRDVLDPEDRYVCIRNGELLSGNLTGEVLGKSSMALVHLLTREHGNQVTCNWLSDAQRVANAWIARQGFSVGISDCLLTSDKGKTAVDSVVTGTLNKIKALHRNMVEEEGYTEKDVEVPITEITQSVLSTAGAAIMQTLAPGNNNLVHMTTAGSKGSVINISQIIACVGQQSLNGRRILPDGRNDRTLPCFPPNCRDSAARGFVKHSYVEGLWPEEFFFHMMAGREGLVDTAVKSVTYDTAIVIVEGGVGRRMAIGEWIDRLIKERPDHVQCNEREVELLRTHLRTSIPTTDCEGRMSWGTVTAVTRHDPGKYLWKIRTRSGRTVEIVESKSLLVWNPGEGRFNQTSTTDISVGDMLPTCFWLPSGREERRKALDSPQDAIKGETCGRYLAGDPTKESNKKEDLLHESREGLPPACYTASSEFLLGLLRGFISVRGILDNDCMDVDCGSRARVEDIAWMCSRLGIFAILGSASVYFDRFWTVALLSMLDNGRDLPITRSQGDARSPEEDASHEQPGSRNKQAEESPGPQTRNTRRIRNSQAFTMQRDVVLDPIVTMVRRRARPEEKVYDLTIPETLNFGLANGLQVVDTATTGYIQHRLVKAMESLSVAYDYTVRTGDGTIVEFEWGGDNFDPAKLCKVRLLWWDKSDDQVASRMGGSRRLPLLQRELSAGNSLPRVAPGCREPGRVDDTPPLEDKWHPSAIPVRQPVTDDFGGEESLEIRTFLECRRYLRRFKMSSMFATSDEDIVYVPFHPDRILSRVQNWENNARVQEDVCTAVTFFGHVQRLILGVREITVNSQPLEYIIRSAFCSRRMIEAGITGPQMDYLMDRVLDRVRRALVCPGEMVGLLSAESTGEPTTQMSFTRESPIVISENGNMQVVALGEWIDEKISGAPEEALWTDDADTCVVDVRNFKILIPSSDARGSVEWRRVTHGTRHPPNGEMIRVVTGTRRTINATLAKSFLVIREETLVPTAGRDLAVGDSLPLTCHPLLCSNGKYLGGSVFPGLPLPSSLKSYADPAGGSRYADPTGGSRCADDQYLQELPRNLRRCRDVCHDKIVSLERFVCADPYVYDLTVPDTLNFGLANGLQVRDTLNTFHYAGVSSKNVTLGVPRMKELVDLSKKVCTPSATIYLLPSYQQTSDTVLYKMAKMLDCLLLLHVVIDSEIVHEPRFWESENPMDLLLLNLDRPFRNFDDEDPRYAEYSEHVIRFELDKETLMERDIEPHNLVDIVKCYFGSNRTAGASHHILTSETNMATWILRIRLFGFREAYEVIKNHVPIDPTLRLQELDSRICHEMLILVSKQLYIGGIKGVVRSEVRNIQETTENNDGSLSTSGARVIDAYGTKTATFDLEQIWLLEFVDWTRTLSNDIHQVHRLLGIEAAHTLLFHEILHVLSFDGTYVNHRHVLTLVNRMTHNGYLMPINRHGINRLANGALTRCSFEETVDMLSDAACFGEVDPVCAVSDNVMLGQLIRGGTGCCKMVPLHKVEENARSERIVQTFISTDNRWKRKRHGNSGRGFASGILSRPAWKGSAEAVDDPLSDWIPHTSEEPMVYRRYQAGSIIDPPYESRTPPHSPDGMDGGHSILGVQSNITINTDRFQVNVAQVDREVGFAPSSPILTQRTVVPPIAKFAPSSPDLIVFGEFDVDLG